MVLLLQEEGGIACIWLWSVNLDRVYKIYLKMTRHQGNNLWFFWNQGMWIWHKRLNSDFPHYFTVSKMTFFFHNFYFWTCLNNKCGPNSCQLSIPPFQKHQISFKLLGKNFSNFVYSSNKTTNTWNRISCHYWFWFFIKCNHIMIQLTPKVFNSKSKWCKPQKVKKCSSDS